MGVDTKDKPFIEALVPNGVSQKLVIELNALSDQASFSPRWMQVNEWRTLADKNYIVLAKVGGVGNERIIGFAHMVVCLTGWGQQGVVTDLFVDEDYRSSHDVELKLMGELIGIARGNSLVWIETTPNDRIMRSVCRSHQMAEQERGAIYGLQL